MRSSDNRLKLGIRGWLLLLTLAAALPVLLFASIAVIYLASAERDATLTELARRSEAVASDVEHQLGSAIEKVSVLTESPLLLSGDFRGFHEYATKLVKLGHLGTSVAVIDAQGRQVLNTLQPFGTPLPHIVTPETRDAVFVTKKPYVSNLFIGVIVRKPIFVVSAPVIDDGKVKYVVSIGLEPAYFDRVLLQERTRHGGVAVVIDRKGTIVARTQAPEVHVGQKAEPEFLAARANGERGYFDVDVKDGEPMSASFVTSPTTGWSTALLISHYELPEPALKYLKYLAAVGLHALPIAALLSVFLSRHLSLQVRSAAQAALALGKGEEMVPCRSNVQELDNLADALMAARSLILEREQRLRAVVDTAADAIIVNDEKGCVQSFNPAAERIFGYSAGEVLGKNVRLLMPEFCQQASGDGRWAHADTEAAGITGGGSETLGRRKDGTTFPIELAVAEWEADGSRFFTGIIRDVTARKRAEQHLRNIMGELSHRTKNALAVAQVIAWQTSWMGLDAEEFADRFTQRIDAMVRSHDLLVKSEWRGISLEELVRSQLAPFLDRQDRLSVSGASVCLMPNAAETFGLALHELATNAMKYGALSCPTGKIEISWETSPGPSDARRFHMSWREFGGPAVSAPKAMGFGNNVIKDMMEKGFGGAVALDFAPDGFKWELAACTERMLAVGMAEAM